MKLIHLQMTRAEARQLLAYLDHRDDGHDGGWYYGPKDQFERRHQSLRDLLVRVLDREVTVVNG